MGRRVGVILSDRDRQMLYIIERLSWCYDWHISLVIGEPEKYVSGRLKQLEKAGLIVRQKILANYDFMNYMTAKGLRVNHGIEDVSGKKLVLVDGNSKVKKYKKRVPKIGAIEHDLGCINTYLWLIFTPRYDIKFGDIVSEKMLFSNVKNRKNGNYVRPRNLHFTDGYFLKNGDYTAIEFERTKKSKSATTSMLDNIKKNSLRFKNQIWIVTLNSISEAIRQSNEYQRGLVEVIDYKIVQSDLEDFRKGLPEVLSDKSKVPPKNNFGVLIEPKSIEDINVLKPSKLYLLDV